MNWGSFSCRNWTLNKSESMRPSSIFFSIIFESINLIRSYKIDQNRSSQGWKHWLVSITIDYVRFLSRIETIDYIILIRPAWPSQNHDKDKLKFAAFHNQSLYYDYIRPLNVQLKAVVQIKTSTIFVKTDLYTRLFPHSKIPQRLPCEKSRFDRKIVRVINFLTIFAKKRGVKSRTRPRSRINWRGPY